MLLLVIPAASQALAEERGKPNFYVMRHLNRTVAGDSLNTVGFANACRLANWFSGRSLAAIYTSRFERAIQTAEPTSSQKGLRVNRFATTSEDIAAIKTAPRPVLIVANTKTVQKIIAQLGGKPPAVEPTGFGKIWVIDGAGRTSTTELPTHGLGCSGEPKDTISR